MGRAANRKWTSRQARYRAEKTLAERMRLVALFGARLFRGYVGRR